MKVSVVIPFYNEKNRLPQTIQKVLDYFKGQEYELILVDDGSLDNTQESIQNYLNNEHVKLYIHDENKGKGAAIQTGIAYARGQYILFTDADMSTPIEEFEKLYNEIINGHDIAIGSRALKSSSIKKYQPSYRQKIGKAGNILIRLILGLPFKDTQCGFKLFKSNTCKKRKIYARLSIAIRSGNGKW